jgi:amidohydrolase
MEREAIRKAVEEIYPYAVRLREQFHRNPELSFEEYKTAEIIEKELRNAGIPYRKAGETGIVAVIRGNGQKKTTIALRTDMDGLPIEEESGEQFSSRNGKMHACGHDLHMAMVLAAGKILQNQKEQLPCDVKLIFQPAEEIGKGAEAIMESGLIQDVDTIYALHMNPQAKTGTFQTGYGARTSQGLFAMIDLETSGNNAIWVLAEFIAQIAEQMPLRMMAEKPYTFSPTIVRTEDPNHVRLFYDGRLFDPKDGERMENIVKSIAREVEDRYSVRIGVRLERIGGSVQNHRDRVDQAIQVIEDLFGETAVQLTEPAMFGEDFRCYSAITDKLVFSMLGGARATQEYPLHNCKVRFDHKAMKYGIAYYVETCMRG